MIIKLFILSNNFSKKKNYFKKIKINIRFDKNENLIKLLWRGMIIEKNDYI